MNDLVYTDVALRSCGYLEAVDNVVRVVGSGELWDGRWLIPRDPMEDHMEVIQEVD